ncbi:MAG: GNAT family N-acetyltransferase [Deltaproteobacteria bacterium]|nr:GNAT family N-acetyltransferase [Deltaproteobacteria bacterium]
MYYTTGQLSVRHQIVAGATRAKPPGNYKKKLNRLKRDKGEAVIRGYHAVDDVSGFLDDARRVFEKSWQARELGRPAWLDDTAYVRRLAGQALLLGLMMFAGEVPVAFDYGVVYDGIYYRSYTAFDEAYAYYSPG